jgi:hypothetical protein
MKRIVLSAALLASTMLSGAAQASYASEPEANSNVVAGFQSAEKFRFNWNKLSDKLKSQSDVTHSCDNSYCRWQWTLRDNIQAMMYESNNGAGDAAYCFVTTPSIVWDCYNNLGAKWNWAPHSAPTTEQTDLNGKPLYTPPASTDQAPVVASSSVPIFISNHEAHIMVGIAVHSVAPLHNIAMLLDTGANHTSIPADMADRLIADGEAVEVASGQATIADGSTVTTRRVVINSMTIGNHVLTNIPAGVMPVGAEPLLGFDVLEIRSTKFTVDHANNQLTFG